MAELLRGVLDAVEVGLVALDADGRVVVLNPAARALLGADGDGFLARLDVGGEPVPLLTAAVAALGLRTRVRSLPAGGAVAILEPALSSESFLDSIVENIPDMIFVKDAEELRFQRVNRAGEELLGQPRAELLGKNDHDFFVPEQAAFFQAKDRETLAGGVVVDIAEEPIATGLGTRWLHTKKIPILDVHGRPRYLLGISEDVTERKLAREALDRAHEELERRVAERTAELTLQMAERERAEAALRASEQHLRQAQKLEAVGRLAGGVAHDFNNLLTVVMTQASLVRAHPELAEARTEALGAIIDASRRAATLTRQLLAFSSRQVLHPRDVDLSEILVGMQPMLQRMLGEQITLTVEPLVDGGWIRADPGQVEQVVLNLVVNARDAISESGRLDVVVSATTIAPGADGTTVPPGRYVVMTVTDTGTGMDAYTQAHLFEPFFTTKAAGRGTGLGLSTVYGIVTQSGGCITVRSELGQGARFTVYFPEVGARAAAISDAAIAVPPAGGAEVVLLVEDDEAVRAGIRAVLVGAGHDVLEAADGYAALRRLEATADAVHVLLTDLVMPQMSGRELARRARALRPALPILFVSGYAPPTDVVFGPGETFLPKPFDAAGLLATLRRVLDAAAAAATRAAARTAG